MEEVKEYSLEERLNYVSVWCNIFFIAKHNYNYYTTDKIQNVFIIAFYLYEKNP